MTRYRHVQGNITETTGGSYKVYSNGGIEIASNSDIIKAGKDKGVNFGEPKTHSYYGDKFSLAIDLAWISMDVMYNDNITRDITGKVSYGLKVGTILLRSKPANIKGVEMQPIAFRLDEVYMNWTLGFRCYRLHFTLYDEDRTAFVFLGTRPDNFFSLTDNAIQAARISMQVGWAKEIGLIARKFPNSIFAGHSKGGREAAQAAVAHGYG
jgi:hypothetical protein